jgi:16S rRNA (cytosine967-C5)-methyltransferase
MERRDARTAALQALLHVDENEGYSNLVLNKTLEKFQLEPREASLASAIFYGVLERRLTLDYYISLFCRAPGKRQSPVVREILRIAVYQILYLEKIPESAAVNEAVNCARENGAVKACGFINGVLRAMLREKEKLRLPPEESGTVRGLSLRHSCPEWLIRLWMRAYGGDCAKGILASLSGRPPVFARVNNTRISREKLSDLLRAEDVKPISITWDPDALELQNTGSVTGLKSFQDGFFHIQDLSSQLCCRVVDPRPGERVVDVCAAPGGKSFTMAERMENRGEVLAFDKYKGKAGLIRQGAARLSLSAVKAGVRDAAAASDDLPGAQRVLCDVPCSGLGIIRRKPEIRYKPQHTLDSLPDLQYLILCRSARLTAPGGLLVYSTCTLNPSENGENAERFLKEHGGFEPCPLYLPETISRVMDEPENELTLMPHIHGTDGFFIAAFRRRF